MQATPAASGLTLDADRAKAESLVQRSRRRRGRRRASYTPAYHLADDLSVVRDTRAYPYILLGIALFIALGFEFVNGFHDTANAVATVIYTNSMSPNLAVIWSGYLQLSRACWSRPAPSPSASCRCCRSS